MRLTKIICTLGPACNDADGIRALAKNGMNIARMNFSHGSHESHTEEVERVRAVNNEEGLHVALLLDTKGAEIRTGDRPEPLAVAEGNTVVFSFARTTDEHPIIKVSYPEFWIDAKDARFILIDSGEQIFDIVTIEDDRVVAKSRGNAVIGSRRHINLPGANVTLPSLVQKDWEDIELACVLKLDYIALSFIRTAQEVNEVRAFVTKHGHPDILLISKIENEVGVKNIDEIIDVSDGVMIARGDLGAEIPLETLALVQDDIARRCRAKGTPVIMATQMLESMMKNPMPTRAEVTDVAHAAMLGVDSTMLSGETAAGKHPVEALRMMDRILAATEHGTSPEPSVRTSASPHDTLAASAATLARSSGAAAIIVLGAKDLVHAISILRPQVPVFACTEHADTARRMQLLFGVIPVVASAADALSLLKNHFGLAAGTKVVSVTDTATLVTIA